MSFDNDNDIRFFSLITLGDSGVGKTCLIKRFTNKIYNEKIINTVGFGSSIRDITLKDGTKIRLKLIDTMGQENYRSIASSYIKNADGVFLVFAHNDRKSFDNIIKWLDDFKNNNYNVNNNFYLPAILLGNKYDLEHFIEDKEIDEIIKENNFYKYINTSAKDNIGINDALEQICEMLINLYGKREKKQGIKMISNLKKKKKKEKSNGCCENKPDL